MITLLLASAFSIQFDGGTPNEFAAGLFKATQQNVVVVQGEAMTVSPLKFTHLTLNQMSQALRTQTGHFMLPGTEMVFSDQLLASKLLTGSGFRNAMGFTPIGSFEHIQYDRTDKSRIFPIQFIPLPSSAISNGQITFQTKNDEALRLKGLEGKLSKPVQFHWIYAEQPIFVQTANMAEVDFLTNISKALGARFNPAAKTYHFNLDPNLIRQRASASLARLNLNKDLNSKDNQEYRFRINCLNSLTPAQISEALATPNSVARIAINRNAQLTSIVTERIKQFEKIQKTYGPNGRASKKAIGLMEQIDPDRPSYIVVDAKFYVMMEIAVKATANSPASKVVL